MYILSRNEVATNGKYTACHRTKTGADSERTFSCAAFDCSEGMSEDRKYRYISYLIDRVKESELDKKVMKLILEDFFDAQQAMKEELAEMRKTQSQMVSKLDEEVLKRKKAEQKAEKLKTQLAFAKKISLVTNNRK